MKEKFKNAIDYKKVEEEMLKELKALPPSANKSTIYIALGQATMEGGDYEKTKMYFQKAEDELKKDPDPIDKERLEKARKELEILMKQENDKSK